MRKLLMAGAALMLGVAPLAVQAQDAVGGTNTIADKRGYDSLDDLDDMQRAEYDAWPATYQTAYGEWPSEYRAAYWGWPDNYRTSYWTWPGEYQDYYWTLEPEQQTAYWVLTNDQRAKMAAMTPAQRTAAWTSIQNQMAGTPATTTTTTSTPANTGTMSGNVRYVSNEMVQATPAARSGEYPICNGDNDDSCINAWEAGKRGRGVNRPLGYWPGEPASE